MLIKKISILIIFLGSFFISCKQETTTKIDKLPYYNTSDFTPTWLSSEDELKKFHKIPNFKFTNQLGNEVTNTNFKGYIYVANFFFTTCPSICIKLTNNMHMLQDIYSKDEEIKLISHTVFPSYDTVEVLKEYGDLRDVNPKKWHLVTGEKEKIYKLAREAYFADEIYNETNDENGFIHTENLILVDKDGHIRGVYKGTLPEEIKRIERHIEILKKES
ncbi:electron transporter [Aquimarina aggregata]|uniref:Electron transporter n=1 Tax=Aquimarina aggregata TaxID=1642818 RepID=A0A163CHQ7_9FLAO|nr:electron transporter [Aquimarina aggregata]